MPARYDLNTHVHTNGHSCDCDESAYKHAKAANVCSGNKRAANECASNKRATHRDACCPH